jgi:hypothetical protein
VQVPAVFIHVWPWQKNHRWFTVTTMSGYVTAFTRQQDVGDLTCAEAAALLGIPPAALDRWAQQLSFPRDDGASADARFKRSEIEALRDALVRTHSVEGAVRAARDGTRD